MIPVSETPCILRVAADAGVVGPPIPSNCSEDRVEIWHGAKVPMSVCGVHATYDMQAAYRAHYVLKEAQAP